MYGAGNNPQIMQGIANVVNGLVDVVARLGNVKLGQSRNTSAIENLSIAARNRLVETAGALPLQYTAFQKTVRGPAYVILDLTLYRLPEVELL